MGCRARGVFGHERPAAVGFACAWSVANLARTGETCGAIGSLRRCMEIDRPARDRFGDRFRWTQRINWDGCSREPSVTGGV